MQHVTIGGVRGDNAGVPIIGNNCVLGTNSVVIGKVVIGNNVFIGAGAVVTKSFPDNVIIGGIPAKIINNNGIKTTSLYGYLYK
jgi:serine O-acetyltransferase